MDSVILITVGLLGCAWGWFFYSHFVATKVFKLDSSFVTPAYEYADGVDFVPTNKYVLWGHHFTSVAGAAPIVGPAIAVYWGWLPAVLWITVGTVFFAGIHDLGALWASNRHSGKSIGALSEAIMSKRTRNLVMMVVFLLLLMVNAVFGTVIARALIHTPSAVLPAWAAIVVALIIGQLLRRGSKLFVLTVLGVLALYTSIFAGSLMPLEMSSFGRLSPQANWILILFIYAAAASMLPVWALLQPRDYINGLQLLVGLVLLYGAVLLVTPEITAPAINTNAAANRPSLVPLLFVTIACGAVSGFHGIVASGTTSKQLENETDARFVGYLGAIGEGALALITVVVVAGVALAATPSIWHEIYSEFGAPGASAFISGGAKLISDGWGIPITLSQTFLATMVVLFAGTTMDSGVRLQRYIIQEWGRIHGLSVLEQPAVATIVAVGCCLLLAFGAGGSSGSGGLSIWPLFGSTNQILAGLTLLIVSVMLLKLRRPVRYTVIPMVFVLGMSFWAGAIKLIEFYRNGEFLLVVVGVVVLVTSLLVILEAADALSHVRKTRQ